MKNTNLALSALQSKSAACGVVGLALTLLGFAAAPEFAYSAYLTAFVFFLGISLGCMALIMVGYLSGGQWAWISRRIFEAAALVLPGMLLLFLPLFFGRHALYPWTVAEIVAQDPIIQAKQAYLNMPFFTVRWIIYFTLWILWAYLLRGLSLRVDEGSEKAKRLLKRLSGAGLVMYGLTMSFAAFDWMMSLDPHWYSTIYGMLVIAGQVLSGFIVAILVFKHLLSEPRIKASLTPDHLHDLGKFLFAFVMFWAYLSFSQFLIIWSANLAEEAVWYVRRASGGWVILSVALPALHFIIPFLLLLSKKRKRDIDRLFRIAALLFVMRWIELVWIIHPEARGAMQFHWTDLTALVGIGGCWLWLFIRNLQSAPLVAKFKERSS